MRPLLQLLIALHIWAARESCEALGMSVRVCFPVLGVEEHSVDLTVLVLQAGSLVTFSLRTSLLACPIPVYTGMHYAFCHLTNCFPTLPPPCTFSSHKGSSTILRR